MCEDYGKGWPFVYFKMSWEDPRNSIKQHKLNLAWETRVKEITGNWFGQSKCRRDLYRLAAQDIHLGHKLLKLKTRCLPGLITRAAEQLSFHAVFTACWPHALRRGTRPTFTSGGCKSFCCCASLSLSKGETWLVQRQYPAFRWWTAGETNSASSEYNMSTLRVQTGPSFVRVPSQVDERQL